MTRTCGFCGIECADLTCADCTDMLVRYERNTIQLASDIVRAAKALSPSPSPTPQAEDTTTGPGGSSADPPKS